MQILESQSVIHDHFLSVQRSRYAAIDLHSCNLNIIIAQFPFDEHNIPLYTLNSEYSASLPSPKYVSAASVLRLSLCTASQKGMVQYRDVTLSKNFAYISILVLLHTSSYYSQPHDTEILLQNFTLCSYLISSLTMLFRLGITRLQCNIDPEFSSCYNIVDIACTW